MWTAAVLGSARKVVFLGLPLYHYVSRLGSVSAAVDMGLADVFDNCAKLESYISTRYPNLFDIARRYCAVACWGVIRVAAKGRVRRRYPELYERSVREYEGRKTEIRIYCDGLNNRMAQILVELGLYSAFVQ